MSQAETTQSIDPGAQAFAEWLAREMPAGTVITDPASWAPKILRAVIEAEAVALSRLTSMDQDDIEDCLMTVEDFKHDANLGALIPDDGIGYWATGNKRSHLSVWSTPQPAWATHVLWFNK